LHCWSCLAPIHLLQPDSRTLCLLCLLCLLQGQVSVAASSALAAEALADRYNDLRALIKLLKKVTQGDWENQVWRDPQQAQQAPAAGGGSEAGPDVAQVGRAGGEAGLARPYCWSGCSACYLPQQRDNKANVFAVHNMQVLSHQLQRTSACPVCLLSPG